MNTYMSKKLPILYTFIRCPWAMRARLALAYVGIEYEAREVDLKNKPQSLLDYSPKGTVPVLILADGKILDESLDIILWAMPKPAEPEQSKIDQLISINDHDFKKNNHQYKYGQGQDVECARAECEKFIQLLEHKLSQHKYLINDAISIADLAVFPLIRQFSMVDAAWFAQTAYKNVQRWLDSIFASSFYAAAMKKQ